MGHLKEGLSQRSSAATSTSTLTPNSRESTGGGLRSILRRSPSWGCTLSSLFAAVLIWPQSRVSPPSKRMTIHRQQRADPALGGTLGGRSP